MKKIRVLFVCTHYGARSRIAEEFAWHLAPEKVKAYSSSFEDGKIGPLPIAIMKELGMDLPSGSAKTVYNRYKDKETFDYVITLCHGAGAEHCPTFQNNVDVLYAKQSKRLSWSVPDFKSCEGTDEERKAQAREIIDSIKQEVVNFLSTISSKQPSSS